MSKHCTIYCAKPAFALAASIAEEWLDRVQIDGANDTWAHIEASGSTWQLRLTSKVYREDGDDFTDLQFSTYMWIDRASAHSSDDKQRALMCIRDCELAIGVSAEPGFDPDERIVPFLFEIARQLDGVIFDSKSVIDAFGHALVP